MNNKKNRRREKDFTWALVMVSAFFVITLVIGIIVFRFYMNSLKEVTDDKAYSQYYVMITDDRKASFWQSVYQGAYERGIEEDVYVDLLGDNLSYNYSREDLMRIAISSNVDGIIVMADESDEMTELINTASENGIPVVTLYGDNTQSKRCSFVGVGSYNLGREYGRQVLKIADERAATEVEYVMEAEGDGKYTVTQSAEKAPVKVAVLVSAYAKDSGQNILYSSIQETIESERGEDLNIEMSLVSIDDTNAFSAEEAIRDIFMEGVIPDIIICLNELNTTCVYQAVVDYNKVGQVNILGYYDSDTIIGAIDRNVIYATVSIDTRQMGSFCVEALREYHDLGYTSQYFTADVELINKENVSEYLGGDEENEEAP